MPWGWSCLHWTDDEPEPATVSRPDRGNRSKTKTARKANRQRRR